MKDKQLSAEFRNQVYNMVYKNGIYVVPFLLFFVLLRISPMLYDGWAGPYYYIQNGGILSWAQYVCVEMRDWINGRVASNFFCGLLESFLSEIPIDFVGAAVLTAIPIFLFKIFDIKSKTFPVLVYAALMILMPYTLRTYTIQIALLPYMPPILFVLVAIYLLKQYDSNKDRKYVFILYVLNAIACTWMENTSVAYGVVVGLYCLMLTFKNKKIDIVLWGSVVVALASGVYMILSPGMHMSRGDITGEGSFLQLSSTTLYLHVDNMFKNLIYFAGLANIGMSLIFSALSLKKAISSKGNKKVKYWVWTFINAIILCLFVVMAFSTNEVQYTAEINKGYYYQIALNIWLFVGSVVGYLAWIFTNTCIFIKKRVELIFMWVYGIVMIAIILFTNQVGSRIIAPFYVLITCFVSVAVGLNVEKNEHAKRSIIGIAVIAVFVLSMDYYAQLYNRVTDFNQITNSRIDSLKEAQFLNEWNPDTYYVLPKANERDLSSGAVAEIDTFHYPQFLERKGLQPNTKVVFTNSKYVLGQEVLEDGTTRVQVLGVDNQKYLFTYVVGYKSESYAEYADIIAEQNLSDNTYDLYPINGSGYYRVTVYIIDKSTGAMTEIEHKIEKYISVKP